MSRPGGPRTAPGGRLAGAVHHRVAPARTTVPPLVARSLAALLVALALTAAPARAAVPAAPAVSAPSAIAVEASTGEVLFARAADNRRAMASATKLMTALLTVERADRGDVFPAADYRPAPVESQIGLRPGERMTVADLLRGLMLESANDAAETLAVNVAGSRRAFIRLMNRRARELGLEDTRFTNPVGLDAPRHFSSARDLARLAVEVRRVRFLRRIANRARATLESGERTRVVRNRNTLVSTGPSWVDGVKTGHTLGAGYVLVGSGTRRGATIVSVVLGTASEAARNQDTLRLLDWGLRQFARRRLVRAGEPVGEVPIRFRRGAALPVVTGAALRRTIRTDARVRVRDVGLPAEVAGPVDRGERLGWREVLVGGRRIARVPIEAAAFVPAAGLAQRTKDWFTRPLVLLVAVGLAGGSVLVARRLRQGSFRRRATRSEPEVA